MKRHHAVILALILVTAAAAGASTPPNLTLTATGATVTASGLTPRGSAFFFGVVHERRRFTPVVIRFEKIVTDDDGDGTVTLDYGKDAPTAVWSVVDMADGRYGSVTPYGPAQPLVLAKDPVVANNGQLRRIVLSERSSHLLVVRPAVGVWGQVLVDGNRFDSDAASNGTVSADISNSVDARGTKKPAPDRFERGDTVVIINPLTLEVYAAQVGEKR